MHGEHPRLGARHLVFVVGFGVALFVFAFLSARRQHQQMAIEGLGPVQRHLTMDAPGSG